ncbi:unnamed protein product [Rotaria sp. Silwood2]|nr:unnamed protein product [Rotaria sp. Silwood2]
MLPLLVIDPRQPLIIDSFEFLYQSIVKDLNSINVLFKDGLVLLADCYILKKLSPLPILLITNSSNNNLSLPDYDEHWSLINYCKRPYGCVFAQNLPKRGYNLILVSTEELKLLSIHIEHTFLIRTVTIIYRWNSPHHPLELTTPLTVGQIPLSNKFHRADSFDRLETIESIVHNANLVLYINCTRIFNDQNPAEFQSIVNNYLIYHRCY